jgi:TIR domain-containing protein
MAPKIFLAHAREDKPQVRKLYADLTARGFDPWLDEVDLVPGQIWKEEIPRAIRHAGIFLACLSSRSAGKVGYVQNEFRLALSAFGERPPGSIYLIPVRLDECDVPDLQIPDRGLSLQDIQWVDLWQEGGFDRLVKAIERALEGLVDPRQARGAAIPLAEPRAKDARERVAPEAAEERMVIAEKEEARAGRASRRKPKAQWMSIRHPTIVAAIITAIATVAAALSPWFLEKISDGKGKSNPPPTALVEKKSPEATPKAVPMTKTANEPFLDCDDCPLMVAMRPESFMMGSAEAEHQWLREQGVRPVLGR